MKTIQFRHSLGLVPLVLVAGCGGGGSSPVPTTTPDDPAPPTSQSPGGIWSEPATGIGAASFYITEDGRLWSVMPIEGTVGPAFGAGAVAVDGDTITGGYEAKGILPDVISPNPGLLTCEVAGTVSERVTMSVDISCANADGPFLDEAVTLLYVPDYDRPSDLDTIAGNYTLAPLAATNTLNIAGDGTLFGMYDNGPSCTVNGQVSLIDPAYNLYDVSWVLSSCAASVLIDYEGAEFTGIATMTNSPVAPEGSFYLLMTGYVNGQFRSISVIYEPN